MTYRIKNWSKFQHYKDRNPPWIKLHYEILSSKDWVMLDDASRVLAIACMLLASRNDNKNGVIPSDLEFIRRVAYLNSNPDLKPLIDSGFLERASKCVQSVQNARPETETETETETEKNILDFLKIWQRYPNKDGRRQAERHFNQTVKELKDWNRINRALDNYLSHLRKETWKQPKNGSTWFNNWEDWVEFKEPGVNLADSIDPQKVKSSQEHYDKIINREIEKVENRIKVVG